MHIRDSSKQPWRWDNDPFTIPKTLWSKQQKHLHGDKSWTKAALRPILSLSCSTQVQVIINHILIKTTGKCNNLSLETLENVQSLELYKLLNSLIRWHKTLAEVWSFSLGSLNTTLLILSALQNKGEKGKVIKVIECEVHFPLFELCVCVLEGACTQTTTAPGKSCRAARARPGARTEPTPRTARTSGSSSHTTAPHFPRPSAPCSPPLTARPSGAGK